jgi:hypothetical protein
MWRALSTPKRKLHNKHMCLWSTKVEPLTVIATAATKKASMVTNKIQNWLTQK